MGGTARDCRSYYDAGVAAVAGRPVSPGRWGPAEEGRTRRPRALHQIKTPDEVVAPVVRGGDADADCDGWIEGMPSLLE